MLSSRVKPHVHASVDMAPSDSVRHCLTYSRSRPSPLKLPFTLFVAKDRTIRKR